VLPVDGLYPIHDVTSSGLTQDWDVVEPNQNRHGPAIEENNFGWIEIEWDQADPVIVLSVVDLAGTTRVSKRVPLSQLEVPSEK
jgi:alkaline phosphatase D